MAKSTKSSALAAGDRLIRPGEARDLLAMSPVTERKHLLNDPSFPSRLEISPGVYRYRLNAIRKYVAGLRKVRVEAVIPDVVHEKRDEKIAMRKLDRAAAIATADGERV